MILSPDHFLYDSDGTYFWTPGRQTAAWKQTIDLAKSLLPTARFTGLVLLAGIPGAGKTTWLATHADPSMLYIDATFTRRAWRKPLIDLAVEAGKPVRCVFVDTPVEVCLARNALRPDERQVPPTTMEKFARELESDPPDVAEGFVEVLVVSPSA